ncbi:apolipoprotein N-acyltransferase [Opitutus terrae]|uniref:Apolipoprotein N-acyltransferase n=1 Tax=Opitutus terrae (strain DSM 11246 / JCM 15787 / PB90-1) TaxID=452637 RepID=B1ZUS9_OPITP|nr:apolipoprotein N-acyltransferase [Opitutus terrae]ACB74963.1 apolipoprotein N-acyltransferase [Opitutus terrae PB90-1]
MQPAGPPDPYDPQPTFLEKHQTPVVAAVVGIATAVLTVLSFPPFQTPEFAYALLVPAIMWAYRNPPLKLFLWTLFAAQAVAWTVLLAWLHHVTWVGLFLLGPVIGAWVGVWYLAAWWTMPRMLGRPTLVRLVALVALAGAWVLIEWTRTWFLSGFPWLPLAASQWERSSILQVAAYTGAGGISFVLVAMNIGFATMAHSLFAQGEGGLNFRRPEFLFAMFLLMACLSIHMQSAFNRREFSAPLGRVAFVQPYIPQDVKWDPAKGPGILRVLQSTTLAAAATKPDLILWPEASTPWAVNYPNEIRTFVESLASQAGAPILLGSVAIENLDKPDERWLNAAFVVDPIAGVQHSFYIKRHLVPFGEYVPLRPLLGWIRKFVPIGDDARPGTEPSPLIVSMGGRPLTAGPLICYEDIFPDLARQSARAGSDFLAVLTNNAWYGEGGSASQHAAHSVLRAVETRRPVLRCGNGGWSGWIDEFGVVRATVRNEEGSIYFRGMQTIEVSRDVRWMGRNTFYVEHGDWFVAASAVAVLLGYGALALGGRERRGRFRTN